MQVTDFLAAVDHQISGGSRFQWSCYGPNARYLDWEQGVDTDTSASAIFDSVTQEVYEVTLYITDADIEYHWYNSEYVDRYQAEAQLRNIDPELSVMSKSVLIDLEEDILEKVNAVVTGRPVDSRVMVEITLSDQELVRLALLAHKRDVTLNQFVAMILNEVIESQRP
jgi:hypothetical protein